MAPLPKVRFIPECHADTTLVRFLTNKFPNVDHEDSISGVARNFQVARDQTYKLVGIVDDDKRTPKYLDDFRVIKRSNGVILKQKPDKEHYLVVITPALEKFLIKDCITVGKSMNDFKLPDNLRSLTKITKGPQIEHNTNFHNLIQNLLKQGAPGLTTLKSYLADFL